MLVWNYQRHACATAPKGPLLGPGATGYRPAAGYCLLAAGRWPPRSRRQSLLSGQQIIKQCGRSTSQRARAIMGPVGSTRARPASGPREIDMMIGPIDAWKQAQAGSALY